MSRIHLHDARGGFALWFTGLSGAGKTTIARILTSQIRGYGLPLEVLDGDVVRANLSPDLGFTKKDRDMNIRRIAFVSQLLVRNNVAVIVAAISPYREERELARSIIGPDRFIEVLVDAPLEVCIERDVKGLYAKALAGEIQHFTGISDPYEAPITPNVTIPTHLETPEESAARMLGYLHGEGWLPIVGSARNEEDRARRVSAGAL